MQQGKVSSSLGTSFGLCAPYLGFFFNKSHANKQSWWSGPLAPLFAPNFFEFHPFFFKKDREEGPVSSYMLSCNFNTTCRNHQFYKILSLLIFILHVILTYKYLCYINFYDTNLTPVILLYTCILVVFQFVCR